MEQELLTLDYAEMLKRYEIFFNEVYLKQVLEAARKGTSVVVDFEDLERFDSTLADALLENPVDSLAAARDALASIDTGMTDPSYEMEARFRNLPETSTIRIRDIRSGHLGKFIAIRGNIKQASQVRPEIVTATWECQACGERIVVPQDNSEILAKPYMCSCGNKKSFSLVERRMRDVQKIVIQESPDEMEGGDQARKITVYIRNDLVDPTFQKRVIPGNRVVVTGIVGDYPLKTDRGQETKRRVIYIDGNYLEAEESEFEEIEITPEDEKKILELSRDPKIYHYFIRSIAPSIHGYEKVKEAITLQLFSGVPKTRPDGTKVRGDIHILLVGDPGAGKSQILRYVADLAPKGRYVVGKSASGAGITAAAVKDEFTGEWTLEAGALVLANGGLAAVDEMDKMSAQDRSAMHEAMSQQTVTVSKANIQATLKCRTIILAAANPKHSRFDPYQPIVEQINLPDSLLSRFDLIFAIRDIPDEKRDAELAEHILTTHMAPEEVDQPLDNELIRKYIAYARSNCHPRLTPPALEKIRDFYVKIRNMGQKTEGEVRPVPLTARQLEALVRLAEASARVRLSETVELEDAERAISLLTFCLKELGTDPETGMIDIDRLTTGISTTQRSRIREVLNLLKQLEEESDDKLVDVEDLVARAEEEGYEREKILEIIDKLKREGEIFEPRPGKIRRV